LCKSWTDHQNPAKQAFVGAGNANRGMDFNQDFLSRRDVNLQQARLVQGTVQQGQYFLMQNNVGSIDIRILAELFLAQVAIMIVTIESFEEAETVLDGFQRGLVQQEDNDGVLLFLGVPRVVGQFEGSARKRIEAAMGNDVTQAVANPMPVSDAFGALVGVVQDAPMPSLDQVASNVVPPQEEAEDDEFGGFAAATGDEVIAYAVENPMPVSCQVSSGALYSTRDC
jgi:hypothetical protein